MSEREWPVQRRPPPAPGAGASPTGLGVWLTSELSTTTFPRMTDHMFSCAVTSTVSWTVLLVLMSVQRVRRRVLVLDFCFDVLVPHLQCL